MRDTSEPDDFDSEALSGGYGALEVGPTEMLKTQRQGAPSDRLPEDICVLGQLVAHGRADQVRSIGIEALLHQEVDLAEVDDAHVDRHLLCLAGTRLPRLR